MKNVYTKKLINVIEINETQIQEHLGELVRGTVEETLNSMLDAEADNLCNATRDMNGVKLVKYTCRIL